MKRQFIAVFLGVSSFLCFSPIASASSLTQGQIQSILTLLQAFGADTSVMATVSTQLQGTTTKAQLPASMGVSLISQSAAIFTNGSLYSTGTTGPAKNKVQARYDMTLRVTAGNQNLYIPTTVGTTTMDGLDYYVSGTVTNSIPTITIRCSTSGSILSSGGKPFCMVPAGGNATFAVTAIFQGLSQGDYAFGIDALNYQTRLAGSEYSSYVFPTSVTTKSLSI